MPPSSAVALTGSDQAIRTGAATLTGWVVRETAGSTATLRIFDGTSAAGTVVGAVSLPANGVSVVPDLAVRCVAGIYVDILSGAVEGSVLVG